MSKEGFHIPSLDGVRAFSFGLVFVAHTGLGDIVPGGFGVTVFFFLSGFLITTLMRLEWQKSGNVSLPKFYFRRVLRILPPFYLVLVSATGLTAIGALRGSLDSHAVTAQFLHFANYWVIWHGDSGFARGTGVYWSLAVEEHFYFLFPLLYIALRKLGATPLQQALTLASLCLVVLLWRCTLVFSLHAGSDRTYMGSDARFDSILFGCILAVYGNPVLDPRRSTDALWKYALFPLGLVALLASFVIRNPNFRETFRYTLQGAALVPIFVCAVRYPQWGIMRVLNFRPVAYIGVLSYSLYLIHQIVFFALTDRVGATYGVAACAVASLLLSVGLALLLQKFVEKPCARLRRRFSV